MIKPPLLAYKFTLLILKSQLIRCYLPNKTNKLTECLSGCVLFLTFFS